MRPQSASEKFAGWRGLGPSECSQYPTPPRNRSESRSFATPIALLESGSRWLSSILLCGDSGDCDCAARCLDLHRRCVSWKRKLPDQNAREGSENLCELSLSRLQGLAYLIVLGKAAVRGLVNHCQPFLAIELFKVQWHIVPTLDVFVLGLAQLCIASVQALGSIELLRASPAEICRLLIADIVALCRFPILFTAAVTKLDIILDRLIAEWRSVLTGVFHWCASAFEMAESRSPWRIETVTPLSGLDYKFLDREFDLLWQFGDMNVRPLTEAMAETQRSEHRKDFLECLETLAEYVWLDWHSPVKKSAIASTRL